jgi:hypothetical protein
MDYLTCGTLDTRIKQGGKSSIYTYFPSNPFPHRLPCLLPAASPFQIPSLLAPAYLLFAFTRKPRLASFRTQLSCDGLGGRRWESGRAEVRDSSHGRVAMNSPRISSTDHPRFPRTLKLMPSNPLVISSFHSTAMSLKYFPLAHGLMGR